MADSLGFSSLVGDLTAEIEDVAIESLQKAGELANDAFQEEMPESDDTPNSNPSGIHGGLKASVETTRVSEKKIIVGVNPSKVERASVTNYPRRKTPVDYSEYANNRSRRKNYIQKTFDSATRKIQNM